jgi:hypothetical protein
VRRLDEPEVRLPADVAEAVAVARQREVECLVALDDQVPPLGVEAVAGVGQQVVSPTGTAAMVQAPPASVVAGGSGVPRMATVACATGSPRSSRTWPEIVRVGAGVSARSSVTDSEAPTCTPVSVRVR